jgi:putative holliday junction resolvase
MRILGIDYGDKKIGFAFGESNIGVAVPLDVLTNHGKEQCVESIKQKVQADDIEKIIVGVPLSQGEHHSDTQLKKVRAFIVDLKEVLSIPIEEEDESYTTTESIRLQKEEGADAQEDALAAMIIVQSYLDRKKYQS